MKGMAVEWIKDYAVLRDLGIGFPRIKDLEYLLSCPRMIEGEIEFQVGQLMEERLNVHVVIAAEWKIEWSVLATAETYTLPLMKERDYGVCVFSGGGEMAVDDSLYRFKKGALLFIPAGTIPEFHVIPMTALVMMTMPAAQEEEEKEQGVMGLSRTQVSVRSNWLSC